MTSAVLRVPITRTIAASVAAAAVVALTVHVSTLLVYSIANSFSAESLGQTQSYFLPASLLAFVVVFVLALLGALNYWYTAMATGIAAGVLAALGGSLLAAAGNGATITTEIVGPLFGTLTTINLAFFVAALVITPTLGRRVWQLVLQAGLFSDSTPARGNVALVRAPSDNLAEGQITHIKRKKINTLLADEQWDAYVAALTENGWSPVEVDAAPDLPDAVFIEDTVVLFDATALITSPGAETRRAEITAVEETVRELGLDIERIELPGTLDGGDVLKVGRTVYVGRGGRTNAEGIRQLRSIVSPLGFTVVAVPVTKVLHLKSAVTALPDGTVIGYPPLVDDANIFDRFLAVPEEGGAHVVVLAEDTVLMAASAPQSAALIADLGYRVVTVDISEFEKLEGCVTCLSVRVR